MKNKVIAIDGHDYAGKSTFVAMLTKKLEEFGYNVIALKAPDYNSDSGKLIRKYLNGKLAGTSLDAIAGLYALNRSGLYRKALNSIDEKTLIIADRCFLSSVATLNHSVPVSRSLPIYKALEVEAGVPLPNFVVNLYCDDNTIKDRASTRKGDSVADDGGQDIHETLEYVKETRSRYKEAVVGTLCLNVDTSGFKGTKEMDGVAGRFIDMMHFADKNFVGFCFK